MPTVLPETWMFAGSQAEKGIRSALDIFPLDGLAGRWPRPHIHQESTNKHIQTYTNIAHKINQSRNPTKLNFIVTSTKMGIASPPKNNYVS